MTPKIALFQILKVVCKAGRKKTRHQNINPDGVPKRSRHKLPPHNHPPVCCSFNFAFALQLTVWLHYRKRVLPDVGQMLSK